MSEKAKPIGHSMIRLDQVESTNTVALLDPEIMGNHGLVVVARHQTGGRGRMGRHWASVPGAQLQFTVVLHPPLEPEDYPILSLMGGLAVARAIEDRLGLNPRLKWPNDVMVDEGKVCGILVEGRPGPGGKPRLVMGIGVNCQGRPSDFPAEVRESINTLANAAGEAVDMEALLKSILKELDYWIGALEKGDRATLLANWSQRALLEDMRVRVDTPAGMQEGKPLGLTAEGYLLVEVEGGDRFVQISGELEWLTANE